MLNYANPTSVRLSWQREARSHSVRLYGDSDLLGGVMGDTSDRSQASLASSRTHSESETGVPEGETFVVRPDEADTPRDDDVDDDDDDLPIDARGVTDEFASSPRDDIDLEEPAVPSSHVAAMSTNSFRAPQPSMDQPRPPKTGDHTNMFKTKIVILGSPKSGKTTIANYLADATESIGGEYMPTHGVRIVEFESNDLELNGRNIDAEVELWDCSGDRKFEKCWPAIQRGAHGVILVYDSENEASVKEIEQWHSAFVLQRAIKPNRVLIFAHKIPKTDSVGEAKTYPTPSSLSHLHTVRTNMDQEHGDALRLEFNNFLCMVISALVANET